MGIDEGFGVDQQCLQGVGVVQVVGVQWNFCEFVVVQGEQFGQVLGGIDLFGCEGGQGGVEIEVDYFQVFFVEIDVGQGIVE